MLVASEKVNLKLTLFRGDYPEKEKEIKLYGIQAEKRWSESGLPHEDWLNLIKSPPEALSFTAKEQIKKHVLKPEGWRSPFVSFSFKKDVARRFALNDHKPKEGLLITVAINFVEKYYLPIESFGESVISLDRSAILIDSFQRRWIYLPNVPFSIAGKREDGMGKFYKKITGDDELLLLGDLQPNEFILERLKM